MPPSVILRNVITGIVATLTMDVLSGIFLKLGLSAPLPPNVVGRWFFSVAHGHPLHSDIARTAAVDHELVIALTGHYAIGITLTILYLAMSAASGSVPRRLVPAMLFGLSTSIFAWLLMFPAMGYGFFGADGPDGTRLFTSSLLNHLFFGLGIWLGILVTGLS